MSSGTTSTIEWIATSDGLPDDDETTVLVWVPGDNEPVWLAYCDENEQWYYVTGGRCFPSHWAEIPDPPAS